MEKPSVYFCLTDTEHAAIVGALHYWLSILEPHDRRHGTGAPNDPFTASPISPPTPSTAARIGGPETGRGAGGGIDDGPRQAPRDRWSHDRQGKEIAEPNAEAYTVRIWHCERRTGNNGQEYLIVKWEQKKAYCHDPKLFPWIMTAAKTRSQIVLYLRQNDGKTLYDHVIGVKA